MSPKLHGLTQAGRVHTAEQQRPGPRCGPDGLHATVLRQMGLDTNGSSYFYNGLDQKLVGVEGAEPITKVIA